MDEFLSLVAVVTVVLSIFGAFSIEKQIEVEK